MSILINSILAANTISELKTILATPDPGSVEEAAQYCAECFHGDYAQEKFDLFMFKVYYLFQKAKEGTVQAQNKSEREKFKAPLKFYSELNDKLTQLKLGFARADNAVQEKALADLRGTLHTNYATYNARNIALSTLKSYVEVLIVKSLEAKYCSLQKRLRIKQVDENERKLVDRKLGYFSAAVGEGEEDTLSGLMQRIVFERDDLGLENLQKYFAYRHLKKSSEVKAALRQDGIVLALNDIIQKKIIEPLSVFKEEKLLTTRIKHRVVDLLKDISLQKSSVYTLFHRAPGYVDAGIRDAAEVYSRLVRY